MAKVPVPPNLSLDGRWFAQVRRLFKRFNLDPDDLQNWRTLLLNLAGHPPGRCGKWSSINLCMLRWHVEVLHELNPGKTDGWCCQEISRNKGKFRLSEPQFEGINPGTLRRRLQDARKPSMRQVYEDYREMLRRTSHTET